MSRQCSYINALPRSLFLYSLLQSICLHHFETLTVAQTGQLLLLSFFWAYYVIMSLCATSFRLRTRTCALTTTIHKEKLYDLPFQI